jgi:hypothetical protein
MRSLLFLGAFFLLRPALAAESSPSWEGVDKTVIEAAAEKAGRKAEPLFDLGDGDLPLFLFLTAGAVGGFIAGYSFRALFPPKGKSNVAS